MAANMMPLLMMSSMASSCSSSVSSPIVAIFFFWSKVAAFFGGMLGKLNPFKALNPFKKRQGMARFTRKINVFRKKRKSFRKFKMFFR